jgi:hypothetical protein
MLQVEQYLKPNGPPICTGTCSSPSSLPFSFLLVGIGALIGQEIAGKIPGSVIADIQSKTKVNIAETKVDTNIKECVVHLK